MKTATTVEPSGIAELLRQATTEGCTLVLVPGPAAHRLTAPSAETALAAALRLRLDLTQAQSWVLATLVRHDCATRKQLHHAMSVNGPPTSADAAVTAMIFALRKKLKERGVVVRNVFGVGYRLNDESRDKIREMLQRAGYGEETVAAAAPPANRESDTTSKKSEAA
jgi:DNA-binding winged helix-turn-helix (wHTH) protein